MADHNRTDAPTPPGEAAGDAIAALPACVQASVAAAYAEFAPHAELLRTHPDWPAVAATLPRVWAGSDFVAQACVQSPALLADLVASGDLTRAYAADELQTRIAAAVAKSSAGDEPALKRFLRAQRRRELVRIAWRDLAGSADIAEVLTTVSTLADALVAVALDAITRPLEAEFGVPIGEKSGERERLVVLALGKLGGGELNFSSDIDLIFAYAEDGETQGGRGETNHEFFLRLARRLLAVLSDATEDGIVFRVDMRLRPNGGSGPLALSFDAMEHYYQTHGREWERYAWIKARAIAGDVAAGNRLLAQLKPFVYRRYIDFGVLAAIREVKESIVRELARKGAEHNIKVGYGGIREIEFLVQAFQLVRGGREPELQQRSLLRAFAALAQRAYLSSTAIDELIAAYRFLRATEHRLQMLRDEQTHLLPSDDCARARVAFAMGFADWDAFAAALKLHTDKVHARFAQAFAAAPEIDAGDDALVHVWHESGDAGARAQALTRAGFAHAAGRTQVEDLVRGLKRGGAYQSLSAAGRARMDRLLPRVIAAAGASEDPPTTLARMVRLIEAIGRRSAYFALLIENPAALAQLARLCAASAWIADWISRHPILLDELLQPASVYTPLAAPDISAELHARLARLPADDLEAQMDALREFRHGAVLRVAAAEIGPGLPPEVARRHLCDIAEAVVRAALDLARLALVQRHGNPRCGRDEVGFAVIAYGKLGSGELGYASDLDLVFLHDACAEGGNTDGAKPVPNELFFARLGQRLIHFLATRTAAGVLYPVDMRLRPSGQAGPLVSNLAAFGTYQREKAWTWEHQALIRARAIGGDAAVAAAFSAIRREILTRPRDGAALRQDLLDMRARMLAAQTPSPPAQFDLKQDRGGIVDIEFMVQYWTLRWAAECPGLIEATENVRLIEGLVAVGRVAPAQASTLIAAYRRYLSIEQRLKLMEHRPTVARAELADAPDQVMQIWRQIFDEE